MRRPALTLLLLCALGGCYRRDTRTLFLHIPEATAAELGDLRDRLLEAHRLLPEKFYYYQDIRVQSDPPGLQVLYNARHVARRNIEEIPHALGFQVNDLPGDAQRLQSHRLSVPPR